MRLQKFLALAGVASRRQAEELIVRGDVAVNGLVVDKLGSSVDEANDRVEYRGRIVKIISDKVYIAINKPVGYISSATSHQGASVLELVNRQHRIYPIGRLDRDSHGLLLLTNDGDFAYKLTHAKFGYEKEYLVKIDRELDKKDEIIMSRGMIVENHKLQPVKAVRNKDKVIRIILKEGINRQIRKMLGHLGYRVLDLERIRIGRLSLGDLPLGRWKNIDPDEV
ncbi:MAG: pseudouridine synthase [Patescibacteria group bacterium]